MQIPERTSLVNQLADIVREGIQEGEWTDYLPGQRSLARQLQVSRPTLRHALNQLRRAGFLQISHGRRMRIVVLPSGKKRPIPSKVIGFLSPIPLDNLSYLSLFLIRSLEQQLTEAGFKLEIHTEARFRQRYPVKALEALVRQTKAACWILHFSTLEIQRWFSNLGHPAVLSKMRHEGVNLPSVDVDYRAIGRHATGTFLSKGHDRIALLLNKEVNAADLALERGVREAIQATDRKKSELLILRHDSSVHGIKLALGPLLRPETRPTAILVAGAATTLSTHGHLLRAGVRVPQDVSLICTVDDPWLAYHVPAVSRYVVNWDIYARRLTKATLERAKADTAKVFDQWIIAEFRPGETVSARNG